MLQKKDCLSIIAEVKNKLAILYQIWFIGKIQYCKGLETKPLPN